VRRFAIVLAAAGIALVAAAAPAWAHVKVEPDSAPQGSDAVLAFVVPNEMDNATTTKVVVQFPTDHPIAEALVEPIAGWAATATSFHVTKPIVTDDGSVNDAVKNVTWTATGAGIAVGAFQEFRVSVGLPTDGDSLAFPTIQTYSNGQSVNWVQVSPKGGPEADTPEPVLTLTAGDAAASTTPATTGSASPATGTSTVKKSDVDTAKTIAIIGIIVGALGLVFGAAGLAMGRRRRTP